TLFLVPFLFNSFINHQFTLDIFRYIFCMKKYHLKTPKVNTLPQSYPKDNFTGDSTAATE
ncbi:hypothetical protein, partial [Nostoc foliaceum]|uniref:hypothetical protein n=1 Tax=Nostoc foliaceum TaxID=2692914 RepID=UPI001A7E9973